MWALSAQSQRWSWHRKCLLVENTTNQLFALHSAALRALPSPEKCSGWSISIVLTSFFACPEIREMRIKDDGGALCLDQDMMGVLKRKDVGMFKDCRIWPKKKITSKDEYHQDFNGTATLTRLSCYF